MYISRQLTPSESDSVSMLKENIKSVFASPVSRVTDTWSARLTIDGKVVCEQNDFFIGDKSSKATDLIRYMVTISSILITLYSFA